MSFPYGGFLNVTYPVYSVSPPPPIIDASFLLLDTTNLKLLDGTNFLLLGES